MIPPEAIELEDPLPDRGRSSEAIGHYSFESFYQAVVRPQIPCRTCNGFADAIDHLRGCPKMKPVPAGAARAGLRAVYGVSERGYKVDPRPDSLGGGWRLQLFERGEEMAGGVFSPDEYGDALDMAQDWMEQVRS